jgi:hypothetical protein
MWSAWFFIECAVGAVAAILVWMLIVAIVVSHLEERRHGPHRAARHGHDR